MRPSRKNTALILIDVQRGFKDPLWGKRNNPKAEENIKILLQFFRKVAAPVIHVQHLSKESNSPLRPGQPGVEFMNEAQPQSQEVIFQKSVHSAFIMTQLEEHLRNQKIEFLIMAGFTTDHCVSTSARMAANLGFQVCIISDATVAFERQLFGKKFAPELVHEISLASLSSEFASVCETNSAIATLAFHFL